MAVWTPPEDKVLLDLYEKAPREEILSKLPHRNWRSIYKRSVILRLYRPRDGKWTKEEKELLREYYPNTPKDVLMSYFPERSWKAITWQAINVLRLKRTEEITKAETIKTNQAKLGVDYPTQSKKVRDKVKETVQEKYGVDNVFQSEKIKKKITKTNIKKYGVSSPQKSKEIKKKTIATNLKKYKIENTFQLVDKVQKGMQEKYGYKSPQQVPEIRKSTEQTNIERYGHKIPSLNPDIKEKIEKTNIEKFGTITPLQNEDIKLKIKNTVRKKYGVDNVAQAEKIKNKARQTCLEKYGVEYSLQSIEIREKGYQTLKENDSFSKSKEEEFFMDYLKIFDSDIEAQKKHPTLNHIIDYYMPKYNLWIQYDGTYWHGKTIRKNISSRTDKIKKIQKRDELQNKCIPNMVRFWSDDVFNSIKNNSIIDFIETKLKTKSLVKIEKTSHQYNKKSELHKEDLKQLNFDPHEVKIPDFQLTSESLSKEIVNFIKKYEWLETIGVYPKWCFTAKYKDVLGGVILINEPTSYSKLLGDSTPTYEALIQRGATASWAPINLGSKLIMFSYKWMIQNTDKRIFIDYGDEKAGEIGTLYQACGFDYIGKKYGDTHIYQHPERKKTFTSHSLKRTSSFRKWCKKNKIPLQSHWFTDTGFKNLDRIPQEIKKMWYDWNKKFLNEAKKIRIERKHKYIKIIGKNKKETKHLKTLKNYKTYPYPKRFY